MFLQVFVCPRGDGGRGFCMMSLPVRLPGLPCSLWGSLYLVWSHVSSRWVSVQKGLCPRRHCPGVFCPRGHCPGGGVSVQGEGSLGGGGVSVQRVSTPCTVKSGWYASYWNAFLFRFVVVLHYRGLTIVLCYCVPIFRM